MSDGSVANSKKPHSLLTRWRFARLTRQAAETPSGGEPFEALSTKFEGEFPGPGGRGVVLVACDKHYYWRFATTLLLSIESQQEKQAVHLHLCERDPRTEQHLRDLATRLQYVELTTTVDNTGTAATLSFPASYFSAARFLLAPLVLESAQAPVLCIDVDGIARKPIWPLFEEARAGADAVIFQPEANLRRLLAAAVGINPTPRGLLFASNTARALASILRYNPTHHIDRMTIANVLAAQLRRGGIAIGPMPASLIDVQFKQGSAIWTPKDQRGKSADAYQAARKEVAARFPAHSAPAAAETSDAAQPASLFRHPESGSSEPGPRLAAIVKRHGAWLDRLGIRHEPWLIFGSAPDPNAPLALALTHARIDINNAGNTAAKLGFGQADLTVRARKKSWEEHRHVDTRGLLWLHPQPPLLLRLHLLGKPYDHIGSVINLSRPDRDALVTFVAGATVQSIGDLGKVTNGVAAACYGLLLGVPHIVLAGISLSKVGHSYDNLARRRRQVDEDAFILDRLKASGRVFTTEEDLARDAGIPLWQPDGA